MVFLILTRGGFESVRSRFEPKIDAVWFCAEVVSAAERAELKAEGWNVSWFTNPFDRRNLESDISTIKEHHPGQIVWVEGLAE